jgi:hypothetical protein
MTKGQPRSQSLRTFLPLVSGSINRRIEQQHTAMRGGRSLVVPVALLGSTENWGKVEAFAHSWPSIAAPVDLPPNHGGLIAKSSLNQVVSSSFKNYGLFRSRLLVMGVRSFSLVYTVSFRYPRAHSRIAGQTVKEAGYMRTYVSDLACATAVARTVRGERVQVLQI